MENPRIITKSAYHSKKCQSLRSDRRVRAYWLLTEKVKIVIVGNKIDDESQRKINFDDAKKLSDENNLEYFEASAKNNIGIVETFNFITNEIFKINNGKNSDNQDKNNKNEYISINKKNEKSSKKDKFKKCCQK